MRISAALVDLANYLSLHSRYHFDWVLVDDGSCDDTYCRALAFARYRKNVTVLRHDRSYGIGRALRTAFNKTSAEYTLVVDTRLPNGPYLAIQLLEALDTAGADVALASTGTRTAPHWVHRVRSYVQAFTCIVRAYRTQSLKTLQFVCDDDAGGNVELLIHAIQKGAAIVAVPIAMPNAVSGHVRALCRIPPVLTRRMLACRAQFPAPYSPQLARG
jgi:glycosyltransferase involved in cell wall biosynthesis